MSNASIHATSAIGLDRPDFAPRLVAVEEPEPAEADWAIAAAVAAILGIAVAVVAYICSVCNARSVNACVDAVRRYFGAGC
jgi:hypothetical protein